MGTTQSLSITLPFELAQMVTSKVRSGEYASESEVIREGLRSLVDRDDEIEKWLLTEVAPDLRRGDCRSKPRDVCR